MRKRLFLVLLCILSFSCASKEESVKSYDDYFPHASSSVALESEKNAQTSAAIENGAESAAQHEDNLQVASLEGANGRSVCKAKTAPGPKKVGKPYYVAGVKYYPLESADGYSETGVASWYGPGFHGKETANGERYNQKALTAAHKTLPLPTYVKVQNLENGREIVVRVNDRGPFSKGRIIDLTEEGARRLGMLEKGTARVKISVLSENENCYVVQGKEVNLDAGAYAVQVGAFSDPQNAARFAEQFSGRATINRSGSTGTALNKVWITGFSSKEAAENAAKQYESQYPGAFVIAR